MLPVSIFAMRKTLMATGMPGALKMRFIGNPDLIFL